MPILPSVALLLELVTPPPASLLPSRPSVAGTARPEIRARDPNGPRAGVVFALASPEA